MIALTVQQNHIVNYCICIETEQLIEILQMGTIETLV